MTSQGTFMRTEIKYLLTTRQKEKVLEAMAPYMRMDCYGKSSIRNVYYDTDRFRLIRNSLEKPVYKEKLRIRSYGRAGQEDPVYVELKKKYRSVVYKRRVCLPQREAFFTMEPGNPFRQSCQVSREIAYFRDFYVNLHPAVFLSYEREAYDSLDESPFRVTWDDRILFRREELTLDSDAWGEELLAPDTVLMEIKTPGAIPLWMVRCLTENRIYSTSFSKYGRAYTQMMTKQGKGRICDV